MFYLEDDGPGIPTSDRRGIFEAGYTESDSGTGFGLSTVKQVVDGDDWDVSVRDGVDGGTRFEIVVE